MKGTITQRSPGSYTITVYLGKDPVSKKKKWHTATVRGTKREAQTACAKLITAITGGGFSEPNKVTSAEFLERWLTHMTTQVDARTHLGYAEKVRANIIPALGHVLLTKLRPDQVEAAYTKMLTSGRRRDGKVLSARTVHHCHRILKQALKQAVKWKLLVVNPCEAVDAPKVEKKEMQTYDMPQTVGALNEMRTTRFLIAYLLAAMCGLRRGEITALRWKNVDLDTGVIRVVQTSRQIGTEVSYKPVKNTKGRPVALSPVMTAELRIHRGKQTEEMLRLGLKRTGDSFVFAQPDGSPIKPASLTNEWKRLVAKHELPRIRFHDLRHTHATAMLASGIHPKIAQERLGHSTIAVTMDLYSHVMPNMQADAVTVLDDALFKAGLAKD
jgi:integrase